MNLKFPRRQTPSPSVPAPGPARSVLERDITVGSLAGIAPADVLADVLLVVDSRGRLSVTGTRCDETALMLLTTAAAAVSRRLHETHVHGSHDA